MTDDQGYGDLSCHGNPDLRTPNLDRLYAASTRLTDFHVDPTCAPTRAALLTGRYSHRVGVWHTYMSRNFLRRDEVTMADIFKANGYRTALFGKWHLGTNYPYRPCDRGFDYTLSYEDGVGTAADFWGNDRWDDTYKQNNVWKKYSGFSTDVFFHEALEYIWANKDNPFFVYLAINVPHRPWNSRDEWAAPFLEKGLEEQVAYRYGSIARFDHNVGLFLREIEAQRLRDNTIIIFMTDNGSCCTTCYNAGMRGYKQSIYEGGHRVPCFISWPAGGIPQGRDVHDLTAHVDLLPTLVDLCGLRVKDYPAWDGQSLASRLLSEQPLSERILYVESQRQLYPEKYKNYTVMCGGYRLVNGTELYNIHDDPSQRINIAPDRGGLVRRLQDEYERIWQSVSQRDREFARPVIRSDKQPETTLFISDLVVEEGDPMWGQACIAAGIKCTGYWPVEFLTPGRYRFELRRWPKEMDWPIGAHERIEKDPNIKVFPYACPDDPPRALDITGAKLTIGDYEAQQPVEADAKAVVFECPVEKGPADIRAVFCNDSGMKVNAYYLYVTRAEQPSEFVKGNTFRHNSESQNNRRRSRPDNRVRS